MNNNFNSHPDSELYDLPHYDWSQPVDILIEYAHKAMMHKLENKQYD